MAQTHAQQQGSEEKIHGDALDDAKTNANSGSSKSTNHATGSAPRSNSIPEPDNGSHARSQAAHLGGNLHDHTKPVGDLRHYEREREPPQEVSRAGKEYRRQ